MENIKKIKKGASEMKNIIGRNRKSPTNEEELIAAYLKANPQAKKADGKDIAAVVTKDGVKGHGLLDQKFNRSHDEANHRIEKFKPDSKLKK